MSSAICCSADSFMPSMIVSKIVHSLILVNESKNFSWGRRVCTILLLWSYPQGPRLEGAIHMQASSLQYRRGDVFWFCGIIFPLCSRLHGWHCVSSGICEILYCGGDMAGWKEMFIFAPFYLPLSFLRKDWDDNYLALSFYYLVCCPHLQWGPCPRWCPYYLKTRGHRPELVALGLSTDGPGL